MVLTNEQQNLLENPISSKLFIHGAAGTGKTTAAVHWLKKLISTGVPAHEILVFVPQRALAKPYEESLYQQPDIAQSLLTTMTLGGLSRRMVDLYWPIVSYPAGFANPNLPPNFLTLETAQYYMAHVVRPHIEKNGFFASLTINRNRIYSQILDNLNKAAIVGFPVSEIGERLKGAWVGEIEQFNIYEDVQSCANLFRAFCLEHNLLDFSLQVDIFRSYLWSKSECRDHLIRSYRHLIVDNIEEDTPVSHDILKAWIPAFDSALLIFDENAGYRFFLGADVQSAYLLHQICDKSIPFKHNVVSQPEITALKSGIQSAMSVLQGEQANHPAPSRHQINAALARPSNKLKYFPDMINWVSEEISTLLKQGVSPGEIVVLAPFMPDVLRFSLSNQLNKMGVPHLSHRPSRALRDEPATQTMLTLASLTFPDWDMLPKRINLAFALMQVIDGLDLVRSQLLTAYIYQQKSDGFVLRPFESVPADIRDRITYQVGQRYDHLRNWLAAVNPDKALTLDFFLSRLFGEVLSQPGFSFHNDLDSGNTVANLIESIQKFRWSLNKPASMGVLMIGKEYLNMVQDGVIAAQYVQSWQEPQEEAVFLAPAYTFLISNRPVDYQFWLDVGSPSWYQRLNQPLTHPHVLSRSWQKGDMWTAEKELAAAHDTLRRLSIGLLNRCRKKIFLGMSELDVRGYENRGLLIRIIQHVLQTAQREEK